MIAARHDEMAPQQLARMAKLISHARLATCERGSHMCVYDDQPAYFQALLPFLHEAHAGHTRG